MPKGEKLLKFLASLTLQKFYGTVTIRFESGKVTHVETEMRRTWRYQDLPDAEDAQRRKVVHEHSRRYAESPQLPTGRRRPASMGLPVPPAPR